MSEIKCYTGSRMPVLGTPVAVVGFNNDDKKKCLEIEAHVFFDGRTKSHHSFELQSDYEHADAEQVSNYINVVNQIILAEIDKIIQDKMVEKNVPAHLYNQIAPCEPKDYTLLLYSLWSQGYEAEVQNIAQNSKIEKLQSEFSKIMKFAKIKVTISAAH
jgi:hypothetical protein